MDVGQELIRYVGPPCDCQAEKTSFFHRGNRMSPVGRSGPCSGAGRRLGRRGAAPPSPGPCHVHLVHRGGEPCGAVAGSPSLGPARGEPRVVEYDLRSGG